MTDDLPEFIGPKACAKLLGVSESTVRSAFNRGEIPGIRVGRQIRFSVAAIRRLFVSTNIGGVQRNGQHAH
jgi:excisionase family DNA binding protein